MSQITTYRVVLPDPWLRVPVGPETEARVGEIVDEAARQLPKDSPPDQIGPWKRALKERLVRDIKHSEEYGGRDFYFPVHDMGGFLIAASFVVSEITAPVPMPAEVEHPDEAVAGVILDMIAQTPDTQAVSVGDTVWARSEQVIPPDPSKAKEIDVPTRRVTYATAIPDFPDKWVLVAFSCAGDGNPDSENTLLVVELFDAIMSTWRWTRAGEPWDAHLHMEA